MTQTIIVRTVVPLPPSSFGQRLTPRPKGPLRIQLEKMEVAHSIIAPGPYDKGIRLGSTLTAIRKQFPERKFAMRKIEVDGEPRCGIWRTN